MSRPPIPIERRKKLGNPGKRPLPKVIELVPPPPADAFDPPEPLEGEAKAAWLLVADAAKPWLAEADRPALLMLAEGFGRRALLVAMIEQQGPVMVTAAGYAYSHPAAGQLATLERQLTSWLGLLGLTPADRAKLGLALAKSGTQLEKLRAASGSKKARS
ncbi:MAG: P27 family phage terminase small subunit [Acidimicrobiia bacterium]